MLLDYKRLNTKLLVEKGKLVKDISRLERQISTIPKVDTNTLKKLCQLSTIYVNAENSLKRDLLKAIFPENVSIDVENRRVRTTYINSLLSPTDSAAKYYETDTFQK